MPDYESEEDPHALLRRNSTRQSIYKEASKSKFKSQRSTVIKRMRSMVGKKEATHQTLEERRASIKKNSEANLLEEMKQWSWMRKQVMEFVEHPLFDFVMVALILGNLIIMIQETDANAPCASGAKKQGTCDVAWMVTTNKAFLVVYTADIGFRLFAHRTRYLKSCANLFDCFIVFFGWVDVSVSLLAEGAGLPGMQALRIFRVARLLRTSRVLSKLTELSTMLRGFACAMAAMLYGFIMICVLLCIFSILAVEVINPINVTIDHEDEWCSMAFERVSDASLLFFQTLVAGDSWGRCVVPIVRKSPLTFLLFAMVLVCIQLGFTNLILSVIVDRAAAAREMDTAGAALEKAVKRGKARQKMLDMLIEIDDDNTGTLSLDELRKGFKSNKALREAFELLDLGLDDLPLLFSLMDDDDSGDVSYEEFVKVIHKAETANDRMESMITRLSLQRIMKSIEAKMVSGPTDLDLEQAVKSVDAGDIEKTLSAASGLDLAASQTVKDGKSGSAHSDEPDHDTDLRQTKLGEDGCALQVQTRDDHSSGGINVLAAVELALKRQLQAFSENLEKQFSAQWELIERRVVSGSSRAAVCDSIASSKEEKERKAFPVGAELSALGAAVSSPSDAGVTSEAQSLESKCLSHNGHASAEQLGQLCAHIEESVASLIEDSTRRCERQAELLSRNSELLTLLCSKSEIVPRYKSEVLPSSNQSPQLELLTSSKSEMVPSSHNSPPLPPPPPPPPPPPACPPPLVERSGASGSSSGAGRDPNAPPSSLMNGPLPSPLGLDLASRPKLDIALPGELPHLGERSINKD